MENKKHPTLDKNVCYAALKARDARFDGRFFVGVSSTGIYCRPICTARVPKSENCTFYASTAAAEAAGYRPCLRCRPELAPGLAPVDASARLARRAALCIEETLAESGLVDIADSLGVTDRHLRRVFFAEFGVAPIQYLQSRKLLLAKSLLTDTALPITQVAFAAGFGSIRRFNDGFRQSYRMTPRDLRKAGKRKADKAEGITLFLGYRPPYSWENILAFLAERAIPSTESVVDNAYRRTVNLFGNGKIYQGWISVTHEFKKNSLAVTVAPELLPVLAKVLVRVRSLFDLNCNPAQIYEKLSVLNEIKPGLCVAGLRLPGCFDSFEMAVRAVLGQQIAVKAARTIAARLVMAYGEKVATPFVELDTIFPTPANIHSFSEEGEALTALGITRARARSIYELAGALLKGRLNLSFQADHETQTERIMELPGFGPWSAEYITMRALGWPDAFPSTDLGIKKVFPHLTAKELVKLSETWRPWRSYATVSIWNSLSNDKTLK